MLDNFIKFATLFAQTRSNRELATLTSVLGNSPLQFGRQFIANPDPILTRLQANVDALYDIESDAHLTGVVQSRKEVLCLWIGKLILALDARVLKTSGLS